MSDIDVILERFMSEWNAGRRPDPEAAVASVSEPREQAELARAIELFLEVAPTPDYSNEHLAGLRSGPEVAAAEHAFSAALSALNLERARESQGLSIRELARRLLARAGIEPTDEHEMRAEERLAQAEQGEIPVERWTSRARAALAEILGLRLPAAPASPGALFRASGPEPKDLSERIDFVADALDASIGRTVDADDPVDRFLFGSGGSVE